MHRCHTCKNITNTKKCANCNIIRYCSIDCQKTDWKRHKLECHNIDLCPICHDKISITNKDNSCQTQCSHRFHLSCFALWIKNNNNCPYCRTVIIT